jgi:HAD superfamily hydrolase (TIGR01484 family)
MKTVVFDLDGTLAISSKTQIDTEMVSLLSKLLLNYNIAIISSQSWKSLNSNVAELFDSNLKQLTNLYLLPCSGGSLYQVWSRYGWVPTYQEKLSETDSDKISRVVKDIIRNCSFTDKIWGKQIDIQESQVIYSIIGDKAPLEASISLDPEYKIRTIVVDNLQKRLPEFEVGICDRSSVYITKKGISRKFGIDELMKRAHLSKDDVVYVGTEIFKGGKDYTAIEMGLDNVSLNDFEQTKEWVRNVLDRGLVITKETKRTG